MARITCIHAHPDDAEIFLGGTLALLARRGHEVTIVTMTPGDCGTKEHSPDVISRMRRAEGAAGAEKLGAKYLCAEFRDMAVFNNDESRRRVTALLRDLRPDLVLTASPSDYHCDHEATSHLVRDACFGAACPNYDCTAFSAAPAPGAIPHLYFADPAEGADREGRIVRPDFVVDITSVFDLKRDSLACHHSQRQWLLDHHGMDNYLDEMEKWTKARGKMAGVTYGEGFRHYKIHPYPQAPLLEDLLGSGLVNRFV
ncbi:MAG: PIG-L family deacetylase [Bryobacterales bacterium]|nr:PIG-L family deacetylase [Bryobacterales bacterium]